MPGKRKAWWEPSHAWEGRTALLGSTSRAPPLQAQVGARRCLRALGRIWGKLEQ